MESIGTLIPLILIGTVIYLVYRASRRAKQSAAEEHTAEGHTPDEHGSAGISPVQAIPPSPTSALPPRTMMRSGVSYSSLDSVPAGWYPDPDGKPCARYWDGEDWTEKTRPL